MNRLKEVREQGVDILLLGHAPRLNPNASKGSTAWEDLADHVLAFHKIGRGNGDEDDEGTFDPETIYFLGTSKKTRNDPFKCYITCEPLSAGFILADSPDANAIDELAEYIAGDGKSQNQTAIIQWAKDNLTGRRKGNFIALLRRGEREGRWYSHRGLRGAKIYEPGSRG